MSRPSVGVLGEDWDSLRNRFQIDYAKGEYHSGALFRQVYAQGSTDVRGNLAYFQSPALAQRVRQEWNLCLPEVSGTLEDGGTTKFLLDLGDGLETESVRIPMSAWDTLCVSSQVGCGRDCAFCETAQMGLIRNLSAGEIVAQWAVARFRLGWTPRNIVFMGMGEPFDNFDPVIRAVDILSDSRGPDIPKKRISLSTAGHVPGIRRLGELDARFPHKAYRTLHLAVSLNGADDATRNELMPINRTWPLAELKSALLDIPQSGIKDALYVEYVLIPGVTDGREGADKLLAWLDGLEAKVNVIPYHPRNDSPWEAPTSDSVSLFHRMILDGGKECRTRQSRGRSIAAACGMLGNKNQRRKTSTATLRQ